MQIKFLAILVTTLFSSSIGQPQVTFKSLLKQALASDQKLQALELKIKSKEYSIAANNKLAPTELSVNTTNLGQKSYSLMVGQEFQLSNQNQKAQNTLKEEHEKIKAEIELQKSKAEFDLGLIYLRAVSFQDHITYLDSLHQMMVQSSEWIKKSIEVGHGSKVDLMRINLDIKEVLLHKSRFQSDFSTQIKQINSLAQTDIPLNASIDFSVKDLNLKPPQAVEESAISLEEAILRKQARVANSKALESDIGLFPNLMIKGGMTQDFEDDRILGQLNIGLKIPLFSNNSDLLKSQQTAAKATEKEADFLRIQTQTKQVELLSEIEHLQEDILFIQTEMIGDATAILEEMNRLITLGNFSFIDYQLSRREVLRIQEEEFLLLEKLGQAQLELKLITGGNTHVLK